MSERYTKRYNGRDGFDTATAEVAFPAIAAKDVAKKACKDLSFS